MQPSPSFNRFSFQSASEVAAELKFDTNKELKDLSRLELLKRHLGKGFFSDVSLGFLLEADGENGELVAVKRTQPWERDPNRVAIQRKMICDEVKIMNFIGEHDNVLRLIAAVTINPPIYLITEYCEHGSLLGYLREKGENNKFVDAYAEFQTENNVFPRERTAGQITTNDLLSFASQIANGMGFIQEKMIVHRDLALRNILLTKDLKVKIADFGLSRETVEGYYKLQNSEIPVAWTAPETLTKGKVQLQSDWWTFGIVLWELFTLGVQPYLTQKIKSKEEFIVFLRGGRRLEKPIYASKEIYSIMQELWNIDPKQRPSLESCRLRIDKLWDILYVSRQSGFTASATSKKPSILNPRLPKTTKTISNKIRTALLPEEDKTKDILLVAQEHSAAIDLVEIESTDNENIQSHARYRVTDYLFFGFLLTFGIMAVFAWTVAIREVTYSHF